MGNAEDHAPNRDGIVEVSEAVVHLPETPVKRQTKAEIRQRPRTARMVLESEEWLFTTLRSIGDAVIVTDATGLVVFMNPIAESLTGWAEHDALGVECNRVFHIVSEETRLLAESPVTKVLRDGVISGLANHTILIAKDGRERSIDDSGSPVRNSAGELTGVVLIFRDVTDKRASDRTVREQRDILQLLFDHIPVLVAFMDEKGHFRWVNRELERVLGWQLGELQARGKSPEFYADLIQREKSGRFENWIAPGWHDFKTEVKSGSEVDISWASVPLSDGTIIGIGQVVANSARNDHMLSENVQLLELMNDRFKVALMETHHRVKNNLQTLSALVDLQMVANEGGIDEDDLTKLKLHIRCLAAIHDLLTSDSRVGAFTDVLSAKDTLDVLVPLLRQTVGADEIATSFVEVSIPMRMGMSLAVLVNELVSNAVKHGGRRVEMNLSLSENVVMLEVCDDGRGFPPDFDPATSGNIGMALIERLSRWDLQGETRYSNHDNGGCVRVTFPLPSAELAVA
jgi:PAS domain S-box-containing protein